MHSAEHISELRRDLIRCGKSDAHAEHIAHDAAAGAADRHIADALCICLLHLGLLTSRFAVSFATSTTVLQIGQTNCSGAELNSPPSSVVLPQVGQVNGDLLIFLTQPFHIPLIGCGF